MKNKGKKQVGYFHESQNAEKVYKIAYQINTLTSMS